MLAPAAMAIQLNPEDAWPTRTCRRAPAHRFPRVRPMESSRANRNRGVPDLAPEARITRQMAESTRVFYSRQMFYFC